MLFVLGLKERDKRDLVYFTFFYDMIYPGSLALTSQNMMTICSTLTLKFSVSHPKVSTVSLHVCFEFINHRKLHPYGQNKDSRALQKMRCEAHIVPSV